MSSDETTRQLDLNLLRPLRALLLERHVSRAAARCEMSQPAMSRTLERLRDLLGDELIVRTSGSYVRTPRGEQLLGESTVFSSALKRQSPTNRSIRRVSRDRFGLRRRFISASFSCRCWSPTSSDSRPYRALPLRCGTTKVATKFAELPYDRAHVVDRPLAKPTSPRSSRSRHLARLLCDRDYTVAQSTLAADAQSTSTAKPETY
jgi:DNA-binding transcriptional LysR family regulator